MTLKIDEPIATLSSRLELACDEVREANFNLVWSEAFQEICSEEDNRTLASKFVLSIDKLLGVIGEIEESRDLREIDPNVRRQFELADWTLVSGYEIATPIRILRGYIVPVQEGQSLVRASLQVFALLSIAGSKDTLDRHFHQGIHYHYALSDGTHTTTMICWDTRWISIPRGAAPERPLFHELHALGAKFKNARPDLWREEKRQSIWRACTRDFQKRPDITQYRSASDNAEAVWPMNRVLTPRRPSNGGRRG